MTKVIMQFAGTYDGPTVHCGQFLKSFDFEAFDGIGEVTLTDDPDEAMQFDSLQHALEFRSTQPKCRPMRKDGKMNRPLTATHWLFQLLEESKDEAQVDGNGAR